MSERRVTKTLAPLIFGLLIACDGKDQPEVRPNQTKPPKDPVPTVAVETPKDETPADSTERPTKGAAKTETEPETKTADGPAPADEDTPLPSLDPELLPPPPAKGSYTPPTAAELAAAAHEDERERCEKNWPVEKHPTADDNRTCARFWVIHHGYGGRHDDFDYDPTFGTAPFTKLTARTMLALANRVRSYCGSDCEGADARAIELLETNASYHYRFQEQNPDAPELTDLLRVLLAGEPIETAAEHYELYPDETFDDFLDRLSPMLLFRLRHAPYARHGRPFEHEDLQAFFYEKSPAYPTKHDPSDLKERAASGLFPRLLDPWFDDASLTTIDHANVARIRAAEKRRAAAAH